MSLIEKYFTQNAFDVAFFLTKNVTLKFRKLNYISLEILKHKNLIKTLVTNAFERNRNKFISST